MNLTSRWILTLLLSCVVSASFAAQPDSDVEKARQHIAALAGKVLGEHEKFVLLHLPAGTNDENAGAKQLAGILGDIHNPNGVVLVVGSEDTTAIANMVKKAFARCSGIASPVIPLYL